MVGNISWSKGLTALLEANSSDESKMRNFNVWKYTK